MWDKYVLAHKDSTPYHLTAWGGAVEKAYGFPCLYIVAVDTQNDSIVGILPVVEMKTLRGKKQLCALPYCDVGGILSDNDTIAAAIRTYLISYANEANIEDLEIRGLDPKILKVADAPKQEKVRMLLSLPDDSEALMAQFKSKLRSQIRKAEKNGLHFNIYRTNGLSSSQDQTSEPLSELTITPDVLDDFYHIMCKNMHNLGSPVHSLAWYQAIVEKYNNNVSIAIVKYEDIAVGAGLVLQCGDKAVIPWASTLGEYNRLAPNMLLYWAVLSASCNNGARLFDFGRSTVGEGTFNFKKQWGCDAQQLLWEQIENGNSVMNKPGETSSMRLFAENTWRKMPLGFTKFLGPKIRPYISL